MEAGKSKIKGLADTALGGSSHLARTLADGHHLAVSSHGGKRSGGEREGRENSFYSHKATILEG